MDIYLINGKSVTLTLQSFDRTDKVLEVKVLSCSVLTSAVKNVPIPFLPPFPSPLQKAAVKLELNASLTYYFSLYLEEQAGDNWICELHVA